MGYDRSESFLFNFDPNGIPFGSKSKGKLSLRSYPIQCERKWNTFFLSAIIVRGRKFRSGIWTRAVMVCPLFFLLLFFFRLIFFLCVGEGHQTGKNIRETGVSRHNGGTIKDPLKHLSAIVCSVMYRGISGGLNWAPMMPTDANLSDSHNHCALRKLYFQFLSH